jgi:hypothetical protein
VVDLRHWFAVHRLVALVSYRRDFHVRVRLRDLYPLEPIKAGRQRVSNKKNGKKRVTMKGLTQRRGSQLRSEDLSLLLARCLPSVF